MLLFLKLFLRVFRGFCYLKHLLFFAYLACFAVKSFDFLWDLESLCLCFVLMLLRYWPEGSTPLCSLLIQENEKNEITILVQLLWCCVLKRIEWSTSRYLLPQVWQKREIKKSLSWLLNWGFKIKSGDDLLSHNPAVVVPSARRSLTSLFEMGRGVTPAL